VKIGLLDSVLKETWDDLFRAAHQLGFAGVELGVGAAYQESPLWNTVASRHLRGRAAEHGVGIASICLHTCWEISPASREESVRERAHDMLIEACDCARQAGATAILVPVTPGGEDDLEAASQRWHDVLSRVAWAAERDGVWLCLENVGSAFARNGEQVGTLADSVGSPNVAVYYDPGNALQADADPVNEVLVLGDRIRQVHIKDPGGDLLGDGRMDIPSFIRALRATGYDGWLILETPPTDDPHAAARANLAYLQALL
jgi:L-ribulose-5-phosphate 3-epimerase